MPPPFGGRPDAAISDTDCEASDDRTHCASYSPLVMTPAGVEWQLGRARPPSPPASAISDSSTNNLPLLPPSLASARSAAHVSAVWFRLVCMGKGDCSCVHVTYMYVAAYTCGPWWWEGGVDRCFATAMCSLCDL